MQFKSGIEVYYERLLTKLRNGRMSREDAEFLKRNFDNFFKWIDER